MSVEDEGFLGGVNAILPALGNASEPHFRNNTHDGNRPSGRKHAALAHQKFGMTPFDQQQPPHLQNPLALVDQKIEERESLRHSTHRSQRSERMTQQHVAQKKDGEGKDFGGGLGQTHQTENQAQAAGSENFELTDYNINANLWKQQ